MAYTEPTLNKYVMMSKGVATDFLNRVIPAYSIDNSKLVAFAGTRSGQSVPGWRKLIRKGKPASSPYSRDSQKLVESYTVGGAFSISYQTWVDQDRAWAAWRNFAFEGVRPLPVSSLYSHLPASIAKAEASALKKTYRKVLQGQQHLNSLAVLAEFNEVVRQFGAPFSSIVKLTQRHITRLQKRRRGLKGGPDLRNERWLDVLSSSYLEYVFGLEPLISDTKDVAEAFARWQYEKTGEARFKRRAVSRGEDLLATTVDSFESDDALTHFGVTVKTETQARVQYAVGIGTTLVAPFGSNERLLQLLGISPRNIVPALWEGLPWSWLIDYGVNIGDIIQGTFASTADVEWIVRSETLRTTRTVHSSFSEVETQKALDKTVEGFPLAKVRISQKLGSNVGKHQVVRTTFTRTIPASLGIPPLIIGFDPTLKRYANLLAVLIQMKDSWRKFSIPAKPYSKGVVKQR